MSEPDHLHSFLFLFSSFLLFSFSFSFSGRKLKFTDRLIFCWMVTCFGIHFFLEGYFSIFHQDIWTHQSFLGQVCKFPTFPLY